MLLPYHINVTGDPAGGERQKSGFQTYLLEFPHGLGADEVAALIEVMRDRGM